MSIEAMKQALEALEIAAKGGGVNFYAYAEELRQAIAEAEKQEPVACHTCKGLGRIYMGCGSWIHCDTCNTTGKATTPPTAQREWVGLTDEEIKPLCDENHIIYGAYTVDFIQAIEAKLKEKNSG
jgi:RecJ-like exonuclease